MKIISVINNRVVNPFKVLFREIRHGHVKLAFMRFFASLFNGTVIARNLLGNVDQYILNYLEKEYSYVLEKYNDYNVGTMYIDDAPVWVCWLQGYEQAPVIVKKCIDSIKKSTTRRINIISLDNMNQYYQLPEYIIDKHKKGYISNTELADILRVSLLSDFGGIWIDATIFIPNHLPDDVLKYNFFSCKRKSSKHSGYVSEYLWTTFLLASHNNCVITTAVKDLFYEYWKTNDYLIDYLLLDYFIRLVYNNLPEARSLIDNLPYNNEKIEELQARMNLAFNQKEYDKLINESNTNFFKLSWRIPFDNEDKNGNMTYFGHFINRT